MRTQNNADKYFPHKELCYKLIGFFYEIRRDYGPGHKESVYCNLLVELLDRAGIPYEQEKHIPVYSKYGKKVGAYRPDFLVDNKVIIEVKSSSVVRKEDEVQFYRYLRNSKYEVAYLVNFSTTKLYIKRIIYSNSRKPFLKISA